jgi:TfoX/Sxy family transcriptional regulator of competence genes
MSYSESIAQRIREYFAEYDNVEEKEMMGGLVFMYNGKMCVGVIKDTLMCRIDKNFHNQAVEKKDAKLWILQLGL